MVTWIISEDDVYPHPQHLEMSQHAPDLYGSVSAHFVLKRPNHQKIRKLREIMIQTGLWERIKTVPETVEDKLPIGAVVGTAVLMDIFPALQHPYSCCSHKISGRLLGNYVKFWTY